jgi:hypothetical protein
MYRLNRITDSDTAAFLTLLNGSEWKRNRELAEKDSLSTPDYRGRLRAAVSNHEKRRILQELLTPARAVTPEDFEYLATLVAGTERTKTLPRLNLENTDPKSRWQDTPGHISMVVLSSSDAPAQEVLANVRQALEPARLLTTRVHVVAPRFVPMTVQFTIVPNSNIYDYEELSKRVVETLIRFFDPRRGWFDAKGWPFGRALYISELYQVLGEIRGINNVVASTNAQGFLRDEMSVDTPFQDRVVRNESGAIKEVSLLPDELFEPKILAQNITIAKQI